MGKELYCPIRKRSFAALPEEKVRIELLSEMVDDLGYPSGAIVVERGLAMMPHLATTARAFPQRRADIVCFARGISECSALWPLLLIECKSVKLTAKMVNQVSGYNHFLGAHFIALANQSERRTGRFDPSSSTYRFIARLPHYSELIQSLESELFIK